MVGPGTAVETGDDLAHAPARADRALAVARRRRGRSPAYHRGVLIVAAVLLLANAVFNAVVWPRFYPRIANDPRARNGAGRRTPFYTVHVVLISLALVLAVISAIAGVVILVSPPSA